MGKKYTNCVRTVYKIQEKIGSMHLAHLNMGVKMPTLPTLSTLPTLPTQYSRFRHPCTVTLDFLRSFCYHHGPRSTLTHSCGIASFKMAYRAYPLPPLLHSYIWQIFKGFLLLSWTTKYFDAGLRFIFLTCYQNTVQIYRNNSQGRWKHFKSGWAKYICTVIF